MNDMSPLDQHIFSKIKEKTIKVTDFKKWVEKNQWNWNDTEKIISQWKNECLIIEEKEEYHYVHENGRYRKGNIKLHTNGFGFVQIHQQEKGTKEVYIDECDVNGAMNGDLVLIKIKKSKKGHSEEGQVIKVITRKETKIVGTYIKSGASTFVIPDGKNKENEIIVTEKAGLVTGHKVIVELDKEQKEDTKLKGTIIEVIGHKNDPGVDILSIVLKHGVKPEFPSEVIAEVEKIEKELSPTEMKKRKDLRHEMIITIDGDDAKDLDDAVQVKKLDNGHYYLGVHIADVSHYVKENSQLDEEAYERSTSIYLIDRVIPMLPHKLSNDLCSLNPCEDRLTLSCEMEIDLNGNVIHYEINESIICSKYRMTYHHVNEIIEPKNKDTIETYKELGSLIKEMKELSDILKRKRSLQGALDFDINEPKIMVDEMGKTKEITYRVRKEAEKMIESFMLVANETVAKDMNQKGIPILYRNHETPSENKIQLLENYIKTKGYYIGGKNGLHNPFHIQILFEKIKGKEDEMIIRKLLLRSMKQAKYTPECHGHYGLAMMYYSHFTSPIRRYPDLLLHRQIKKNLHSSKVIEENKEEVKNRFEEYGMMTSEKERRAIEIEREVENMKKAEYIAKDIGKIFEGVISSVTKFGFYVEIEDTIEGLVHSKTLTDDYYQFDEKNHQLIGKKTKKLFRLGEKVKVKLKNVNIEEGFVEFQHINKDKRKKKKENNRYEKNKWRGIY